MDSTEIIRFLKMHTPLFEDFPDDQLEKLVQESRTTTFEPTALILSWIRETRSSTPSGGRSARHSSLLRRGSSMLGRRLRFLSESRLSCQSRG